VDSEAFSSKEKSVGVEGDKIEGPGTPQDAPNVENVEIFKPGGHFTSIPTTHDIGAAGDSKISQNVFNMLNKVGKHTLGPMKHPPNDATAHSDFRVGKIPCVSEQSENFVKLVEVRDYGGGTHTFDNAWRRRGNRLSTSGREKGRAKNSASTTHWVRVTLIPQPGSCQFQKPSVADCKFQPFSASSSILKLNPN
jgi:hypothetical protein